MHMKVSFEHRNFLLNRFPATYADLLAQVADKVKTPLSREAVCYFTDRDGDRIVVADDSDLLNVRDVCVLEGKDVCKLAVEQDDLSKQKSFTLAYSSLNPPPQTFEAAKYLAYLKKALPPVHEDFGKCLASGMPCEDCLGVGKTKDGGKCENCYGRGVRPLTKHMKLVMQYIDFKFQQYVVAPLEAFVSSDPTDALDKPGRIQVRDSNSSIDDNFSKADTKKVTKNDHMVMGFFGREPPPSENGLGSPRKMSHRDDFNKQPMDD